jgi:uncharacterized protein YjbI with pentapeptide repeats
MKKSVWLTSEVLRKRCIALMIAGGAVTLIYVIQTGNIKTGFGKDETVTTSERKDQQGNVIETITTTTSQDEKTLWDWLGLLGVPVALAILGYVLQQFQQSRADQQAKLEKEIAKSNQREEALQDYLDRLSELLIDKNLIATATKIQTAHETQTNENPLYPTTFEEEELLNAAVDVIRARTLSILRSFEQDTDRKGYVMEFLSETEVISKLKLDLSGGRLDSRGPSNIVGTLAQLEMEFSSEFNELLNIKPSASKRDQVDTDSETESHRYAERMQELLGDDKPIYRVDLSKINLFRPNLSGINLSGVNLSSAKLVNATLQGANLSSANLSNAEFIGAKLTDAKLKDANLSNAKFTSANLSGADLSSANLSGANLIYADLIGADLTGTTCNGTNLHNANLSGADLSGVDLSLKNLIYGTNFSGANIRGANLNGAKLFDSNLSDTNLKGANLKGANLKGANLKGANLRGANLVVSDLSGADLSDAALEFTDFSSADLSGANLNGASLSGANLNGANLSFAKNCTKAQLETAHLCNTHLPIELTIELDLNRDELNSNRDCEVLWKSEVPQGVVGGPAANNTG